MVWIFWKQLIESTCLHFFITSYLLSTWSHLKNYTFYTLKATLVILLKNLVFTYGHLLTYLFSTATLLLLLILIFPWHVNHFYSAKLSLLYDATLPLSDAFWGVRVAPAAKSKWDCHRNLGRSLGLSIPWPWTKEMPSGSHLPCKARAGSRWRYTVWCIHYL